MNPVNIFKLDLNDPESWIEFFTSFCSFSNSNNDTVIPNLLSVISNQILCYYIKIEKDLTNIINIIFEWYIHSYNLIMSIQLF